MVLRHSYLPLTNHTEYGVFSQFSHFTEYISGNRPFLPYSPLDSSPQSRDGFPGEAQAILPKGINKVYTPMNIRLLDQARHTYTGCAISSYLARGE
jgi:hypothetical protein